MKRVGVLLFFTVLFSFSPHAQMLTWAVTVVSDSTSTGGNPPIGEANSIIQSKDGGYLLAGTKYSFDIYNYIGITKLDSSGKLQWSSNITNQDYTYGNKPLCNSVAQAQNGGYILVGYSGVDFGAGAGDVSILQIDSIGNLQWSKTIGGIQNDEGYSVALTKDSGYAIVGITASYGAAIPVPPYESWNNDVYVIKINSTGNIQWTETIGGAGDDEGFCIIQTRDGGYAITGETDSYGAGGYDVYVLKLTSTGNIQWTKTIGGKKSEWGNSIIQSRDGGYAITGGTNSFGDTLNGDVYIVKLDSTGNLQWTKTVGTPNSDVGKSIVQTNNGDFVIAGYWGVFGGFLVSNGDEYFIRLDSLGNLKRTLFYGDSLVHSSLGESMIQTKNGGFAIGGYTSVPNSYYGVISNYSILLLDSAGNNCDTNGRGGKIGSGGIAGSGGTITSVDSGRVGNSSNVVSKNGGTVVYTCGNNSTNIIVSPIEVNPDCHNFPDGRINLYLYGGASPFTYTWSPSVSDSSGATGLSAGTYTININDSLNDNITIVVTLISSSSPLTFRTKITNCTCAGNNNGSASIDSLSGTPPYTYLWSTGVTNEIDSGLSAGTYSITVSDSCGNTATASIAIGATPDFIITWSTITNAPCYNGNDGSATINVSGGKPPFTYLWSDASNQTTATAIGLSAGTYTVNVSDFCGGIETDSLNISQPSVFGVNILSITNSPDSISCMGGTIKAELNVPVVVNFYFDNSVQHFVVPNGVTTITLTIAGAQGGDVTGRGREQNEDTLGGNGASFTGKCTVTTGEVLSVVVGQQGGNAGWAGGGGGASWVYDSIIVLHSPNGTSGLLASAAGGGGGTLGNENIGGFFPGGAGGINLIKNVTTIGSGGSWSGGTVGNGGNLNPKTVYGGGGGGGWLSNGGTGYFGTSGGNDEANHFSSVDVFNSGDCGFGGFGGGGGASLFMGAGDWGGAAGGGGGYNGGGGGAPGGGGGGSFFVDTLPVVQQSQTGNGFVSIAYMSPGIEAKYHYSWSNGETTLNASGLSAGTYTLTVTDSNGCTATASATISEPTTLINSSNISIYPNPTAGSFTVTDILPGQQVDLYDCLGQHIGSTLVTGLTMQVNLTNKPNGVYLIRITNEGCKTEERKIVKTQ